MRNPPLAPFRCTSASSPQSPVWIEQRKPARIECRALGSHAGLQQLQQCNRMQMCCNTAQRVETSHLVATLPVRPTGIAPTNYSPRRNGGVAVHDDVAFAIDVRDMMGFEMPPAWLGSERSRFSVTAALVSADSSVTADSNSCSVEFGEVVHCSTLCLRFRANCLGNAALTLCCMSMTCWARGTCRTAYNRTRVRQHASAEGESWRQVLLHSQTWLTAFDM
jgi:hypothetical protein